MNAQPVDRTHVVIILAKQKASVGLSKALLNATLSGLQRIRYTDHIEEHGAELFKLADGLGLEGIVAKRGDAPYPRSGRSKDWVKVKTAHGRRIDEERAKWNER